MGFLLGPSLGHKQRVHVLSFDELDHLPEFRPLVKVNSPDVLSAADATEGSLATEEQQSTLNAKRILDEAFRGPWETR